MVGVQMPSPACHARTRYVEAVGRDRDFNGLVKHSLRDRTPPQDWGGHSADDSAGRSDGKGRVNQVHARGSVKRESHTEMRCPPFPGREILAIVCPGGAGGPEVFRCHPGTVNPGSTAPLGTSHNCGKRQREIPEEAFDWRLVTYDPGVSGAQGATQRTTRIPCARGAWESRPHAARASAGRCRAPSPR